MWCLAAYRKKTEAQHCQKGDRLCHWDHPQLGQGEPFRIKLGNWMEKIDFIHAASFPEHQLCGYKHSTCSTVISPEHAATPHCFAWLWEWNDPTEWMLPLQTLGNVETTWKRRPNTISSAKLRDVASFPCPEPKTLLLERKILKELAVRNKAPQKGTITSPSVSAKQSFSL